MVIVPQNIEQLQAYKAGKTPEQIREELGIEHDLYKLASNENPYGPSPKGIEAIQKAYSNLHLYPDGGLGLRRILAQKIGRSIEEILCSHGSEAVMATAFRTFITPGDEIITAKGTFVGVRVQADIVNADLVELPLTAGYKFDLEAILGRISSKTKIVYIASPNNPTGTYIPAGEFESFMARVPKQVLVIWDEAYFEYATALAADYPDTSRYTYDNLLTLRTFSKAYGMAAARIGYGIASPHIIAPMLKVKLPFEPSSLSQQAGIGALSDEDFLQCSIATNSEAIRQLQSTCDGLGVSRSDSVGNFIMIDCKSEGAASDMATFFLAKGIITRPLAAFGLPHCLRISTGLPEQNEAITDALREFSQK